MQSLFMATREYRHGYSCADKPAHRAHHVPVFLTSPPPHRFFPSVGTGTGRTGFIPVPPNNYPFYNEDEKYVPVMQADGGQLSEWKPMYHPTAEQAEADRKQAYETGVPHGFVAPGDKYKSLPTIDLTVISELHTPEEYGITVDAKGGHSGGPFVIHVSPKMRIEDLRRVIYVRILA